MTGACCGCVLEGVGDSTGEAPLLDCLSLLFLLCCCSRAFICFMLSGTWLGALQCYVTTVDFPKCPWRPPSHQPSWVPSMCILECSLAQRVRAWTSLDWLHHELVSKFL